MNWREEDAQSIPRLPEAHSTNRKRANSANGRVSKRNVRFRQRYEPQRACGREDAVSVRNEGQSLSTVHETESGPVEGGNWRRGASEEVSNVGFSRHFSESTGSSGRGLVDEGMK